MPKANIAHLGGSSRERSKRIEKAVLEWVFRWDFVSDESVRAFIHSRFGSDRPRYAYQMWRKGLLRRHKVRPGVHLPKTPAVYSLPNDERRRRAKEGSAFWCQWHAQAKIEPAWSSMHHNLQLQALCAFQMEKMREQLTDPELVMITEPETRKLYVGSEIVPDAVLYDRRERQATFIELECNLKNPLRRQYWAQMYADLIEDDDLSAQGRTRIKRLKIEKVMVVIEARDPESAEPDPWIELYEDVFYADTLPSIVRNSGTRKLGRFDGPPAKIRGKIRGKIQVEEWLGHPVSGGVGLTDVAEVEE